MKLDVLTWNTLFAGRDGLDDGRAKAQAALIDALRPDVFLMQEARGFEAHGGAGLYEMEQRPGMRGFLAALPAHHRARYVGADSREADRSVMAMLEAAGWVDVGHALGGHATPTAPTAGYAGTEFAPMRCDYLLASQALAAGALSYRVIRTPETDAASDHYPVLARFDVLG